MTFVVTMGCTKDHRLQVSEAEARRLMATACTVCHRPLFAVEVKGVRGGLRQSTPVAVPRCSVHDNGDPCCRRQKAGAQ